MQIPVITDDTNSKAEHIRTAAETGYAVWRNRGELNPDAIRAGIARAYLAAKTEMEALQARTSGDIPARQAKLTAAAFGLDDIAGSNPATRAQLSVSLRDAQDRAEGIDPGAVQEALALFNRASATGDELLCRALAQRAWDLGGLGGWEAVLDAFTESRPAASRALTELGNLVTSKPQAIDYFAFVLVPPAELTGLGEYAIEALAAGAVN